MDDERGDLVDGHGTPGGYDAARSAQTSSGASLLPVRTQPGQMALHVTPEAPASMATARVNPTSACFDVT
jgi:hypothetical protein